MVEIILLISIIITIFLTRLFEKKGLISFTLSRKILHIVAIGLSALVPIFSEDIETVKWIVGIAIPIVFVLVSTGFFSPDESGRKSWGIFYYTIVFFSLLHFFPYNPQFIYYPLMVLAIADGVATLVGKQFGREIDELPDYSKTLAGSLAFFVACLCVFHFSPTFVPLLRHGFSLDELIIISIFIAVVEFLAKSGRDNIWIPIAVVYWLIVSNSIGGGTLAFAIFTAVVAAMAFRFKWLSIDGMLAAFVVGAILIFSPEPMSAIPAFVFFIVGSATSKLPGREGQKSDSRRKAVQVFSNALAPTLAIALYFVSFNSILLYAGIAGFATALSDTVSSEIGTRYGGSARDIFSFKKVPKGLSGGVTLIGTLAGLFASFVLVGVSSILWFNLTWFELLLIALIGFAGNLTDSILGSALQVKYFNSARNTWGEKPDAKSEMRKGVVWMDNNRVNFLATLASCILAVLIFAFGV